MIYDHYMILVDFEIYANLGDFEIYEILILLASRVCVSLGDFMFLLSSFKDDFGEKFYFR